MAFLFLAGQVAAQGFFKRFMQGHNGYKTEVLSDGYRVWSYSNQGGSPAGYVLRTDWEGQPLDTVTIPAGIGVGFWFADGSYLELSSADTTVRKRNSEGDVLWTIHPPVSDTYLGVVADDGSLFLYDDYAVPQNNTIFRIQKYGTDGVLRWNFFGTGAGPCVLGFVVPTPDGGLVTLSSTGGDVTHPDRMIRIDANGNVEFDLPRPASAPIGQVDLCKTWSNGITGIYGYSQGPSPTVELIELWSNQGQLLQTLSLETAIPQAINVTLDYTYSMTANGDIVFLGEHQVPFTTNRRHFLARMDTTGQLRWIRYVDELGFPNNLLSLLDIQESGSGELLMTGLQLVGQNTTSPEHYWIFWKTDSTGIYRTNSLGGLLVHDENVNCLSDSDEPALKNWILRIDGPGQQTYFTQSGSDGHYTSQVETGTYTITALPPNYLWEPCDTQQVIDIPADTANFQGQADFPFQALSDCPLMTVSFGAPYLNFCDTTIFYLQYCNRGTALAESAAVEVELPGNTTFAGSAQTFSLNGQTVRFELGNVLPGACGSFSFAVLPACDSSVIEQTLCLTAHIFPDTICDTGNMLWSGGGIAVSGLCTGDSVQFRVTNIGFGPTSALDFIIADDHVVMLNGIIDPLAPGETRQFSTPASGHTIRFSAEQEPNFPGATLPSVAVEACTQGSSYSTGFVNQFPNSTGNPFEDMQCRSFYLFPDSTALSALPAGAGSQHLIGATTPIEYLVYFVNNGSNPVGQVTITDTLPAALDPGTIVPGAASAPYNWSVSGANVLTLQRTVPLGAGQSGFIQFTIDQAVGNAPGTVIENQAWVRYDQQGPVLTNSVWHTVAPQPFFPVSVSQPSGNVPALHIFPNPGAQTVYVETGNNKVVLLRIWDQTGRLVREQMATGSVISVDRQELPPGIYFLEQWQHGALQGVGKLVWK